MQTTVTKEEEVSKLQAQVEDFKASSFEKDTLIDKYGAMLVERKGQSSGQHETPPSWWVEPYRHVHV